MATRDFDSEVSQLFSIFPDVETAALLKCLKESPNMEQAIDKLLNEGDSSEAAANELNQHFTPPEITPQSSVPDVNFDLQEIENRQARAGNVLGTLFNKVCNLVKGAPVKEKQPKTDTLQSISQSELEELIAAANGLSIPQSVMMPLLRVDEDKNDTVTVQFAGAPNTGKTRLLNATVGRLLLPSLPNVDYQVTPTSEGVNDCTLSMTIDDLLYTCSFNLADIPPAQQKAAVENNISLLGNPTMADGPISVEAPLQMPQGVTLRERHVLPSGISVSGGDVLVLVCNGLEPADYERFIGCGNIVLVETTEEPTWEQSTPGILKINPVLCLVNCMLRNSGGSQSTNEVPEFVEFAKLMHNAIDVATNNKKQVTAERVDQARVRAEQMIGKLNEFVSLCNARVQPPVVEQAPAPAPAPAPASAPAPAPAPEPAPAVEEPLQPKPAVRVSSNDDPYTPMLARYQPSEREFIPKASSYQPPEENSFAPRSSEYVPAELDYSPPTSTVFTPENTELPVCDVNSQPTYVPVASLEEYQPKESTWLPKYLENKE